MAQPQLPPNPVSAGLSFGAPPTPQAPASLPPNPVSGQIGGAARVGGRAATGPQAHISGGGGLFGSIGHFIGGAGHWIASKASLAGHDLKAMPAGAFEQTEAAFNDYLAPHVPGLGGITVGGKHFIGVNDKSAPHNLLGQLGTSVKQTGEHPFRDPFATAMWLLPGLHGAGHVGLGAADALDAIKAGEGAKGAIAALKEPKLLKTPRTLKAPGGEPVSLASSRNALRRIYQAAHDKYVQRMIDTKPESIVAKYGASRMHGSLYEISRAKVRYRQAIVSNLRKASQPVKGEIAKAAKAVGIELQNAPKTVGQAAIELVSHNTTPEDAILRSEYAIEQGINPELNQANIQLYREIQNLDLVHNKGLHVEINPAFVKTSRAEEILNHGATQLDTQIADRNLRPEEQLTQRRDLPAAVTQRLKPYEQEKVTPALRAARENFERVDRVYQKALDQEAAWRNGTSKIKTLEGHRISPGANLSQGGEHVPGVPEQSNPFRDRVVKLGMQHEEALTRLRKLEARNGITQSAVPEDLQARSQLLDFAKSKFGEAEANKRVGLLDARAQQFARENDVPAATFYRQYLRELQTPETISHLPEEIAPLYETAPALQHEAANEMQAALRRSKSPEAFDQSLERFMPNAADAYEAGHAENIGVLYDKNGNVIRGSYERRQVPPELSQAVEDARYPNGGFTLRQDLTLDPGAEGEHIFALAPYEERIPASQLTPEAIDAYAAKWRHVLESDPSLRIGGWHNPDDGMVYLDISKVTTVPREAAMDLARKEGQLAVVDRGALARGDFENAFPSTGLGAAEADVIKSAARARVSPEESAPGVLSPGGRMTLSVRHAVPETITHEALHAIRQSLPELLQRKFERRYGVVDGQWTRAQEEQFVHDMIGVADGQIHDPDLVRNFHQMTAFLPGRSFTPLKTLVDQGPQSPMARANSSVIGLATDPLDAHFTSGKGLLAGRHQEDVVDAVARHWHNVFRFFNTQDWRNLIAKTGSDVRRSSRDILVRVDNRTESGAFQPKASGNISAEIEKMIGRKRDTAYTPQMEGEDAGILASFEQFVNHLFPGRDPNSAEAQLEATAPEGTKAPDGYKWVDSETAKVDDLVPRMPATGIAKHVGNFFDNVNAAVTAATVYFKLGHFGTRIFTNAGANIMQGSANPLELAKTVELSKALTPDEKMQGLAISGTHYYEALPGAEGEGRLSRMIRHGVTPGSHALSPQWWAGYIDAPFRLNSIAYEVRQSAYGPGVDAFRKFLGDFDHYNQLDPAQRAEVDGVVRRANREAIAYDRLNDIEKRYLSRAIWFYPWVKGSTVWTANALFEHPFKSAAAVQTGVFGRQQQAKEIGDLPSYSYGVFLFTHGEKLPLAADFSTFNPAGTAGDVLQIPAHEADLAGMLNPALGAADEIAHSENQYGTHTNHPLSTALSSLVSATPEAQAVSAISGARGDQSHREYPAVPGDPFSKTWLGEVLRGLIGPGTPRRFNPEAAHSLAKRERTGK